jgi:hypothetical protein
MTGSYYEIVVTGRPGDQLMHRFADLEIRPHGDDSTLLVGWLEDQAALQGLIKNLAELGLDLVSLREVAGR